MNGSRSERRGAYTALGELADPAAAVMLCQQLYLRAQGKVDGHFQLELLEAAGKRSEAEVQQRLQARQQGFAKDDELAPFRQCLQGGDGEKGRELFLHDERAHCAVIQPMTSALLARASSNRSLRGPWPLKTIDAYANSLSLPSSRSPKASGNTCVGNTSARSVMASNLPRPARSSASR